MKRALYLIVLLAAAQQANAATAFLQSCQGTTSVTGHFIYLGTYNYAGQVFQMTFASWCPQSVQVR